jgi:hypothetical protein
MFFMDIRMQENSFFKLSFKIFYLEKKAVFNQVLSDNRFINFI